MNQIERQPQMYPPMRLPNGQPHQYPPPAPSIDPYNPLGYFDTGRPINDRTREDLAQPSHQWQQDPFTAPAAFDNDKENIAFAQENHIVTPDSTGDQPDCSTYQHLEPAEIAQHFDGRSDECAPYPVPIHRSAARAMLHIPMASQPQYSLLVPSKGFTTM